MNFKIQRSDAQWQALLATKNAEPAAFSVTRQAATERPHTGKFDDHFEAGQYQCICCGNALFDAAAKFDAGCGWPSFDQSLRSEALVERTDHSHGMHRCEVLCADCGAHLGHVFDDGPTETGLRYCMNSAALDFERK